MVNKSLDNVCLYYAVDKASPTLVEMYLNSFILCKSSHVLSLNLKYNIIEMCYLLCDRVKVRKTKSGEYLLPIKDKI